MIDNNKKKKELLTWLEKKRNEQLKKMKNPGYDWEFHKYDGMAEAYQTVIDKLKSL